MDAGIEALSDALNCGFDQFKVGHAFCKWWPTVYDIECLQPAASSRFLMYGHASTLGRSLIGNPLGCCHLVCCRALGLFLTYGLRAIRVHKQGWNCHGSRSSGRTLISISFAKILDLISLSTITTSLSSVAARSSKLSSHCSSEVYHRACPGVISCICEFSTGQSALHSS